MSENAAPTASVESSATDVLNSMTGEQHHHWRMTGELPSEQPKTEPKKEESAPSKESAKTEESQPSKEPESSAAAKASETAPASETGKKKQEQSAKKLTPAEKRIKELLAKNKELETQNRELQTRATAPRTEAEKKTESAKETKTEAAAAKSAEPAARPKADDKTADGKPKYASLDEYIEALSDWKIDQKLSTRDTQQQKADLEKRVAKNNAEIQANWKTRVQDAIKKHADFQEVALADDFVKQIKPGSILDAAILRRPSGTEYLYHLAQNPDEFARILALVESEPAEVLIEIGKFETALANSSKKEEKPKAAPAEKKPAAAEAKPHTEVGGRATAPPDEELAALETGDFGSFRTTANAREMAKRKVH